MLSIHKIFRILEYQSNIANGLGHWSMEGKITYSNDVINCPGCQIHPWLHSNIDSQGSPFPHWPLAALWPQPSVTSRNITIPARRQLPRSGSEFVKDVNVQPWWLLPRQPSLTNSQQLQRPDKASPELETQYSLPPAATFIVTVGGGRVIYCFHELRCPPFPWAFKGWFCFI